MDDWYPIFVQSNGRWIFVCWCPWQTIRNWLVLKLRAQGWNAQAFYQPNTFQRDPMRPPYRADLNTDWQRVMYRYAAGGEQLLGYAGTRDMGLWLAQQVAPTAYRVAQVQGNDNPGSLRTA